MSSDGGVLLVRQADQRVGLTAALDEVLTDPRDPSLITHRQLDLLRQRIYGLASGYEDLNDHDSLRHDIAWQTAVERDSALASSPTLCRLENRADRKAAGAIHKVFFEQFVSSFDSPPDELVLDFDATDDIVHGTQDGRAFHGYYNHYCFLPLYVFCGERLLVSYLRPSNVDPARHAWAILALLVKALRQVWPKVRIIFRGDSGFCRRRMFRWCERNNVEYITGIAKNSRLLAAARAETDQAEADFAATAQKVRRFSWLDYAALTWDRPRRIILKAEHNASGSNPRFVISNIEGDAKTLYDDLYCARGDMENRIKEQQLGLFADRTSAHAWWPNQLRLLLSSSAYILLETVRRLGLHGTELERAQVQTIRLKLLKIGTILLRNTRRIRLLYTSAYPYKNTFLTALARLAPT